MKRTLTVNYKLLPFLTKPQPIKVAIGGRGCVSGDTLIDTPQGQIRVDCFLGGEVYALTERGVEVVYAERPIQYAPEQLYMVTFQNGVRVQCTDQHRFLTPLGWRTLLDVQSERLPVCVASHPLTIADSDLSASGASAQHCFQKLAGFLYSYFWYCHQYDQQLPPGLNTYLDVFQQLTDERQHNCHALSHGGDQGFWNTRNPSRLLSLLSSLAALLSREEQSCAAEGNCNTEIFSELTLALHQACQQFRVKNNPRQLVQQCAALFAGLCTWERYPAGILQTISGILLSDVGDSSYSDSISCNRNAHYTDISSCVETTISNYWDFFVPIYNNYLSNGVVNHNSGKSLGIGDMLTFKMATEGADIYCLREFQDSIVDSVHKVFKGSVEDRLQLPDWQLYENRIEAPNGARTTYKGANRNPDAMQSAQGYKYSWFEEAHRASQASLDKLLPTILRNPGAQCWFSANPQSSGDPFSQRFIVPYLDQLERNGFYEDDLHYIVVVNWRDNPWWNAEQEALRKWDMEHLPRAKYDWIWEGKFLDTVDDAIIQPEWFDACIDAHLAKGAWNVTGKKVVSHDPSDLGNDAKGLAFRHGSVFYDVRQRDFGDVADGCDWATSYAIQKGANTFVWDGDGMGIGLRRQIADNFKGQPIEQHIFRGSEGAAMPDSLYEPIDDNSAQSRSNKDTFKNKRAQFYIALRDRMYRTYRCIEKGEYHDPDEMISFSSDIEDLQALRSELCRIPQKHNSNGKIQIMSKDDMKRIAGIESPNMADAVMMSLAIPDKIVNKQAYIPPPIKPMGKRHGSRRH